MPDEPTIPNATCPPFAGASARDLLAGILLASGGSATEIPNTTQCREWGYGKYTQRDLLAAILLAIESGGGGDVFNPDVAYVQTNGDDGTGEIGNPARPYLTAQAAFDNGAVNFHIGAGITTTINIVATGSDDLTAYLFITGTGLDASVVSVVATAEDGNVDLRVRSNLTCQFGTVEGTSNNGGSCYTEIIAVFVTYFNSQCPSGTASAKAAFSEVSVDSSGLLPSSAYMTRVGATSYP